MSVSIDFEDLTPDMATEIGDHPNFVAHGLDLPMSFGEWSHAIDGSIVALAAIRDGSPIAAAGITELWPGRATAWSVFGPSVTASEMVLIHRRVKIELDAARKTYPRIEAQTPSDYAEGVRWLEMLGMQREGTMRKYGPDGRDYELFSVVT